MLYFHVYYWLIKGTGRNLQKWNVSLNILVTGKKIFSSAHDLFQNLYFYKTLFLIYNTLMHHLLNMYVFAQVRCVSHATQTSRQVWCVPVLKSHWQLKGIYCVLKSIRQRDYTAQSRLNSFIGTHGLSNIAHSESLWARRDFCRHVLFLPPSVLWAYKTSTVHLIVSFKVLWTAKV